MLCVTVVHLCVHTFVCHGDCSMDIGLTEGTVCLRDGEAHDHEGWQTQQYVYIGGSADGRG